MNYILIELFDQFFVEIFWLKLFDQFFVKIIAETVWLIFLENNFWNCLIFHEII